MPSKADQWPASEPLPFPADLSDAPVRAWLGDYGSIPLEDGIRATYHAFKGLLKEGKLSTGSVA
jgi:hypothetical protein